MRRLSRFLAGGSGSSNEVPCQVADGGDLGAARHLDALARACGAAGWTSRAHYGQVPAVLQVFASDVPDFGESVRVKAGVGGVPWFVSSWGEPLAPCHDLPGAVAWISASLGALVAGIRKRKESSNGQA